jgi:hypothetical protein
MRQVSFLIVAAIVASAAMVSYGQVPVPPGYKVKKGKDDKGRDVQFARTGHVTNYDESKVKPYTLPDQLIVGDLGWIYHTGGHTCPPGDWRAFYEFADRHFKMKR